MTQQYDIDLSYIRLAHKYECNFHQLNDDDQKGYLEAVIRLYGKELLEGEFLLAAKRLLPEQFHTSQNTNCSAVLTFNQILFGTLVIIGNVLKYTTAISNHNNQINTNQYSIGKFGNLIIPTGNKIHHTTFTELFNKTATNFELLFGHNITHGITPRSSYVLFDSTIQPSGICHSSCYESWTTINNKPSSVVNIIESTVKIQDKNSVYWQNIVTHEFTHLIMSYIFKCRDITPLISEGIAEVNAIITTNSTLQGRSLPLHSNCNMYNYKLINQYRDFLSIGDYDIRGSFIIYLINVHPEIFYKWLHTRGDVNEVINQCNFDHFKQWFYAHCVQRSIVLSNEEQFTLDKYTKFLTTPKTITNTLSQYSNKNKIFSFNHKTKQYEVLRCNTTDKENVFDCEYTNDLKIPADYTTLIFTHYDQGHEYVVTIIKRLDLDKGFIVSLLQEHSKLECIDYGQKLFIPNTLNQMMKDNIGQIQWDMSDLYKVLKEGNICQQITTEYQNINFIYTTTLLAQNHYNVILDEQSYDETHTNNNTNILHIYRYLKLAGIAAGIMGTTIVGVIVSICGYKKYIKSAEQHEPQGDTDGISLQPLTNTSSDQNRDQFLYNNYKELHAQHHQKEKVKYYKPPGHSIKLMQQDKLYGINEKIQDLQLQQLRNNYDYNLQVTGHNPDAQDQEFG